MFLVFFFFFHILQDIIIRINHIREKKIAQDNNAKLQNQIYFTICHFSLKYQILYYLSFLIFFILLL